MKVVDRKTFLQMPKGTVFCKIQFREPKDGEHAYSKDGWDAVFGIEEPSILVETIGNDFIRADLGGFYPKEGRNFDALQDICDNLGKDVPFEMVCDRDGLYDDTHVHFAIFSKEEVKEIIKELEQALIDGYSV